MKRLLPLLLTLLLCACEKELSWHRDDIADVLQMNAQLVTGDTLHYVHLALSKAGTIAPVRDGAVRILVNGRQVTEGKALTYSSFPGGYPVPTGYGEHPLNMCQQSFSFRAAFQPGDLVRIEAEAGEGRRKAWSEVVVPEAPAVSLTKATVAASGHQVWAKLNLKGEDTPGRKDYYRIGSACVDGTEYLEIDPGRDPVLTEGLNAGDLDIIGTTNRYALYSDARFDGKSYTLSFNVSGPSEGKELTLTVLGITQTEFAYLRALEVYDALDGDTLFTEPASFPDNVEGGVGMVSIATPARIVLQVRD